MGRQMCRQWRLECRVNRTIQKCWNNLTLWECSVDLYFTDIVNDCIPLLQYLMVVLGQCWRIMVTVCVNIATEDKFMICCRLFVLQVPHSSRLSTWQPWLKECKAVHDLSFCSRINRELVRSSRLKSSILHHKNLSFSCLSDLNCDFLCGCSERNHVLMDEPYTVGDFSPENYDKKFRGQVRFWILRLLFISRYFYVPSMICLAHAYLHYFIAQELACVVAITTSLCSFPW